MNDYSPTDSGYVPDFPKRSVWFCTWDGKNLNLEVTTLAITSSSTNDPAEMAANLQSELARTLRESPELQRIARLLPYVPCAEGCSYGTDPPLQTTAGTAAAMAAVMADWYVDKMRRAVGEDNLREAEAILAGIEAMQKDKFIWGLDPNRRMPPAHARSRDAPAKPGNYADFEADLMARLRAQGIENPASWLDVATAAGSGKSEPDMNVSTAAGPEEEAPFVSSDALFRMNEVEKTLGMNETNDLPGALEFSAGMAVSPFTVLAQAGDTINSLIQATFAPLLPGELGRYAEAEQKRLASTLLDALEYIVDKAPAKIMNYISHIDRELPKTLDAWLEAQKAKTPYELGHDTGAFLTSLGLGALMARPTGLFRGAKVQPGAGPQKAGALKEVTAPLKNYTPSAPHTVSNAHSVQTINSKTRWGKGNSSQYKTIALKETDMAADLRDINAGKGLRLPNNDVRAPSGRIYGTHPGEEGIFPRKGQEGFVDLTQAEFKVLTEILKHSGLKDNARKAFEKMRGAGNAGLTPASEAKLLRLYEDWASWHNNN